MERKMPIMDGSGHILGRIWRANGTWFADPKGSQDTMIPCRSETDAEETVRRLGKGEGR